MREVSDEESFLKDSRLKGRERRGVLIYDVSGSANMILMDGREAAEDTNSRSKGDIQAAEAHGRRRRRGATGTNVDVMSDCRAKEN